MELVCGEVSSKYSSADDPKNGGTMMGMYTFEDLAGTLVLIFSVSSETRVSRKSLHSEQS
eukprot:m.521981 g.521981  ORF g.521981 m.521981 type:complete len:60 (+) comp21966_c0_seq1:743-922(+)